MSDPLGRRYEVAVKMVEEFCSNLPSVEALPKQHKEPYLPSGFTDATLLKSKECEMDSYTLIPTRSDAGWLVLIEVQSFSGIADGAMFSFICDNEGKLADGFTLKWKDERKEAFLVLDTPFTRKYFPSTRQKVLDEERKAAYHQNENKPQNPRHPIMSAINDVPLQ